jgi:hypothetical protein
MPPMRKHSKPQSGLRELARGCGIGCGVGLLILPTAVAVLHSLLVGAPSDSSQPATAAPGGTAASLLQAGREPEVGPVLSGTLAPQRRSTHPKGAAVAALGRTLRGDAAQLLDTRFGLHAASRDAARVRVPARSTVSSHGRKSADRALDDTSV